jgi:hypothetical protein
MGWEDDEDEWDADDIEAKLEAQLKEKERERRREQGLPSESEDEDAPKPKAATKKPKAKPKPKAEPAPEPVKLDPVAEKLRLKKLEEERDARLAGDLFKGFEKEESLLDKEKREKAEIEEAARKAAASKPKVVVHDAFDDVQLKVQADVERLSSDCLTKFDKSTLQKGGPVKFLVDLFKNLEENLDLKELTELEKSVAELVKDKKAQKGAVDAKANKANTKLSKTTKFNASSEWEEVYGGGEGDEEWTAEEWEEWEKKQAAKAGKK